jgi:hypothetical protein
MTEIFKHLRPYQAEAGAAIMESVYYQNGLTITVEIARQGGKNELSSQLETWLLMHYADENKNLIKCSPTFKPQTVTSMLRLKEKLNTAGLAGRWTSELGYIIRLGECRAIFLSADEGANVVGNTAHLLLEVDEAQDVNEEKYTKEFKPMGATTNVTNVLYGTTWDDSSLLEKIKQINLELERKDGIKRHFRYDWQEIAKYNKAYLAYVETERERLGENHPLFMTQYRLLPLHGGGGFMSTLQRVQLQGAHPRQRQPAPGKVYVAGIDLAGEAETGEDDYMKALKPKQDSTVFTIGEVEAVNIKNQISNYKKIPNEKNQEPKSNEFRVPSFEFRVPPLIPLETSYWKLGTPDNLLPSIRIVEQYSWTGRKHPELYPQLVDLIKNVWRCRSVAVDATGIGQPVASFLQQALGSRIIPFTFTAQSKSELAFNLLAAVNSGGLKMYAPDSSMEYQEFWHQIERAKGYYRPSRTMNFYVDQSDGHDDYLMSLALLVEAGRRYEPREARGR